MTPPTLRTPRLTLRALEPADADALFPAFSDAETMHFWSRAPFEDVAALREWLLPSDAWPAWAIVADGAVVGRVALGTVRRGVGELGYLLGRDRRGRGYAGEAVGALLDHGFGALGLRRIFADVDPDNAASIALLRRLGFRAEGRLRAAWDTHIGVRDSLIFGLLAGERAVAREA